MTRDNDVGSETPFRCVKCYIKITIIINITRAGGERSLLVVPIKIVSGTNVSVAIYFMLLSSKAMTNMCLINKALNLLFYTSDKMLSDKFIFGVRRLRSRIKKKKWCAGKAIDDYLMQLH